MGALGSAGLGGLFGGLFAVINGFLRIKQSKADHVFELAKMDKDKELLIAEANSNIRVENARTEGTIQVAEMGVLGEAIKGQEREVFGKDFFSAIAKSHPRIAAFIAVMFAFAEFTSKTVRPFLTYYLFCLSSVVTYLAWSVLYEAGDGTITTVQAYTLFSKALDTVFFLTVSSASFWFVDRSGAKAWRERHMQ